MSQNTVVVISRHAEDYYFAEEVAKNLKIRFTRASSQEELHDILSSNIGCFILWDYDSILDGRKEEARFNHNLITYFEKHRVWHRVFAITSRSTKDILAHGSFHLFAKYILRSRRGEAAKVYSYVIQNILLPEPFATHDSAGIEDLQIQKSKITNSARKKATLQALGIILEKKAIPKRVTNSIIQGTDELILNAVYDAPIDETGRHYKHALDRGSEFDLKPAEEVEFELITSKDFLQVSITDSFGSLTPEGFLPLLAKNFSKQAVAETKDSGRGLGLYQILNSGLSLQVIIEPKKRTRMNLFMPWVENVRELRDSFRFFCLRVKTKTT